MLNLRLETLLIGCFITLSRYRTKQRYVFVLSSFLALLQFYSTKTARVLGWLCLPDPKLLQATGTASEPRDQSLKHVEKMMIMMILLTVSQIESRIFVSRSCVNVM
jgi:hypothetical protein